MGWFRSVTSQLFTSDKSETQAEELFTDFDETVAKLQQFELEAFEDNDKSSSPDPQSRMKE
ncbi:hypothetical protein ACQKC1_11375 [Shewanella baltica]|uniref:hypothetical protein n=1 Tax=Shewanella baltica TaxID=62322 RepID=UPI003CFCFF55